MNSVVPDQLGDWFRRVGTQLSNEDYEEGIRLLAQVRRTAPTPPPGTTGWGTIRKPGIAQIPERERGMFIRTASGSHRFVSTNSDGVVRNSSWSDITDFEPDVLLTKTNVEELLTIVGDHLPGLQAEIRVWARHQGVDL